MPLFVEVAKQKHFSRAADNLDMYVSTLGRRIALLEKEMGVPLFLRNTRNVELTESGKVLLERCQYILAETDSAWEAVVGNMTSPAGAVRVSMAEYAYHGALRGVFSRFASEWPGISLSINFNEEPVDLMTAPFDVDFRAGPLPDSTLKAKKVLHIEPGLYASPKLLEFHPMPKTPEDLRSMPCINFSRIGSIWFLEKGKQRVSVPIKAAHSLGSLFLCLEFALAGHGVALLSEHLFDEGEQEKKLVRILPDWTGPKHDMYLVTAGGQTPRRIKIFVDYVADYLGSRFAR